MPVPLFQVDAFTSRAVAGNPAAVCLLEQPAEPGWMQAVAAEMNLSETAFLCPQDGGFNLRWFTPTIEGELCGHATIASSHVLWESGRLPSDSQARFHTLSGLLTADCRDGWIELDFPSAPAREVSPPPGLLPALGVQAVYIGKT